MNIKVIKRNGKKEPVMLDKILDRIKQQTYGLDQKLIIPFEVAQKVIEGITPDIKTYKEFLQCGLDNFEKLKK